MANIQWNQSNIYTKTIGILLIVLIPVFAFFLGANYQEAVSGERFFAVEPKKAPAENETGNSSTTPPVSKPGATPPTGAKKTATATDLGKNGLDYGTAVNTFKNTRIQILDLCQLQPTSIVLKNNVKVMFDNRSKLATSITLAGTKAQIGGYDFRIFALNATNLPQTITISCGSGRNSGQITLN